MTGNGIIQTFMQKGKAMTDYIKREDAMELIDKCVSHTSPKAEAIDFDFRHGEINGLNWACDIIEAMPSADVALIRHGHWIFNQEDMTLHCSCCDEVFRFEEDEKDECLDFMEYAKYCLACGAVMDEEVDA